MINKTTFLIMHNYWKILFKMIKKTLSNILKKTKLSFLKIKINNYIIALN